MPKLSDYERTIPADLSCKCGSESTASETQHPGGWLLPICVDCGGTRGPSRLDPLITLAELQALMEREGFTIAKNGGSWRVRCMRVDRCFQAYALPDAYQKFAAWRATVADGR